MQNSLNRLSLKNKLLNSDYYWLSKAASIFRAAFLLKIKRITSAFMC